MRTFSAQVVPDEAVDGRVVWTSLQRGPPAAVVVCGECAAWLAVGHRPPLAAQERRWPWRAD